MFFQFFSTSSHYVFLLVVDSLVQKLNLFKQASAATVGVSLTSALYWFLYLRYQDESVVGVDRYFLARKLINCIDALLPSF